MYQPFLPFDGGPTDDEMRLAIWHATKQTFYGKPAWLYNPENLEGLQRYIREANEQVELWAGICKSLGRDVDAFCKAEMKDWKKRVKALNWLREWWNGDRKLYTAQGEYDIPYELEPLIATYSGLADL